MLGREGEDVADALEGAGRKREPFGTLRRGRDGGYGDGAIEGAV